MAAITSLTSEASTNKYTVVITNAGFAGKEDDFKTLITAIFNKIDTVITDVNTHKTQEEIEDIVGAMFESNTETRVSATYDDTSGKINLVVDDMSGDNNTTYSISCVDGDNSDEEKIRLTAGGSGSGTDDVVLEAGTGLSIARNADKITFTNTVTDTTYSVGDGGLTTNDFTNDDHTKLNGIEDNATADQTKADINALDITEVGTITSGIWQGTAIADSYISSASTWNAKQPQLTFGLSSGNTLRTEEAISENDILLGGSAHVKGRTYAELKSDLSLDTVENGAQVNVSGNSGNAAVYDNGGDAALKTGITGAEVRAAIGAGTSNLALGTTGSTALAGNTAVGDSNVKSNWNESDSNSDAFIQNKPNVQYTSAISTGNNGLVPAAGSAGEFLKHDGTFGTPSYIANTDTDVSISNLESRLGQLDNTTIYIGSDQNRNLQPRGETNFGHAASFVNQPTDTYASSTHYIQWDQGNKYNLTLQSANINFLSHPIGACNLLLKLTQPASGSTFTSITWTLDGSDTLLWPSGTNPTLSSANGAVDILSFYFDGTSKYYGVASLNFS